MGFKQLFDVNTIDFDTDDTIHLYTDGSCLRNGQPDAACGWAFVCFQKGHLDKLHSMSGGCIGDTNNRMEMTAVLNGLCYAERIGTRFPVIVYSDSKYVIDTLKGIYSINKNQDLWHKVISQVRKFQHIKFEWVKGHASDIYNNQVDKLANSAAKKYDRK